jgi:hypothetical protein
VRLHDAPGYEIRSWRPSDGPATWELAQRATSEALQWLKPLRGDRFQPNWWQRAATRIGDLAAGRRTGLMLALQNHRIAAMLTTTASLRGGHHGLSLIVDPDHADLVEAALLSRALCALAAVPNRMAQISIDKSQGAAIAVLRSYGFEESRTLLTLCKRRGPR